MQIVVSAETPAVEVHVSAVYTLFGKLAKLAGPLVKARQLMILCRVVLMVVVRFGLYMGEDAGVDNRTADQLLQQRCPSDLLLDRDKMAGLFDVLTVPLGHGDIVASVEEAKSDSPRVLEFSEGVNPSQLDLCRPAGRVLEMAAGVLRRLYQDQDG